ncbi:unnamed protein product [Pleuronectes platessa]|uniref:Uncharacterized protein n=1 Tax=Pleuronectes platessa TaxID=8262 RepID=A0A9N7UQM3_PLEPL|nr:unnamed protein product [Pleuronectes platessa]
MEDETRMKNDVNDNAVYAFVVTGSRPDLRRMGGGALVVPLYRRFMRSTNHESVTAVNRDVLASSKPKPAPNTGKRRLKHQSKRGPISLIADWLFSPAEHLKAEEAGEDSPGAT